VLWGDGSPTREFLHVRDAARGIVLASERYDGAVVWDADKPNGQPRRCLDTRRAAEWFGFKAEVPLEEGLRETVEWYCQACTSARVA